jgi:cytochrome c biogenesis protein CcdA
VFILLGLSATTLGHALFTNHVLITRISGLAVLAMALFVAGALALRAPWPYAEHRFHPSPSRFGPIAAPGAGVAFGLFSKGIVTAHPSRAFALAVLVGATTWVLLATATRLPVSTTHALIGAGLVFAPNAVQWHALVPRLVAPLMLSVTAAYALAGAEPDPRPR